MSNYGAIPPSSRTSSPVYQGPFAPPASRTSVQSQSQSRSPSRNHSQSSSLEDIATEERNTHGPEAPRSVRFASPQGRGRADLSKLGTTNLDLTNERHDHDYEDESPTVEPGDPQHSSHPQRGMNGVGNGESNVAHNGNLMGKLRDHFQPTLVLENAGSVARDHLASERTFLAYVRTSLAIASSGVGEFACRHNDISSR